MKRIPVYALIKCAIATEMFAIYQEVTLGGQSAESQDMWAAAGKVRNFVDAPRVKDHHAFLMAQIELMRKAHREQMEPS